MINLYNYNRSFLLFISTSLILINFIKYRNQYETFTRINKGYAKDDTQTQTMINQLKIYPDNLSRSYCSYKKDKILLIISGFRDTPKMWFKLEKYLKTNHINFVIPRINGFGRSEFQFDIKWSDWVLSIMDELSILQNLYHQVDILGFSTGCNIALYISQFKWNCKINNIIMAAPNFLPNKGDIIFKNIFKINFISYLFTFIYPVCHRPYESRLSNIKKKKIKNTKNNIFYEKNFPSYSAIEMWKFQDILPTNFNGNKIIMIKANNDKIVGNVEEQKLLIEKNLKLSVELLNLPSNENSNLKVGHNIFNSDDIVIYQFFYMIKKYII